MIYGIWFLPPPEDISVHGHLIDSVIQYTDIVMTIFFSIVVAALVFFIIKYRSRQGHTAVYETGIKKKYIIITILLGMLVFCSIDAVIEHMSFRDLDQVFWNFPKGDNVLRIELMPQQFAWNIRYAGVDGVFATADDLIAPISQMHVPVGTPVVVQMAPLDVIHTFYVPNLRIKQDATPGMVTTFWFETKKEGNFEIACSQLCGNGHYKMRGSLIVESKEKFNAWIEELVKEKASSSGDVWGDASDNGSTAPKDWGWTWQELRR